jgi:hypothetical protein
MRRKISSLSVTLPLCLLLSISTASCLKKVWLTDKTNKEDNAAIVINYGYHIVEVDGQRVDIARGSRLEERRVYLSPGRHKFLVEYRGQTMYENHTGAAFIAPPVSGLPPGVLPVKPCDIELAAGESYTMFISYRFDTSKERPAILDWEPVIGLRSMGFR